MQQATRFGVFITPPLFPPTDQSLQLVITEVCGVYGVSVKAVKSPYRGENTALARNAYFRIAGDVTGATAKHIGWFVNRGYPNVVAQRKVYDDLVSGNRPIKIKDKVIRSRLRSLSERMYLPEFDHSSITKPTSN